MRSGANSVQHLLTPAALGVLKHAVTEARRRGHPQVQPLHVVSMLLAHAGSRLRQACMLSHPQNAQSAECRALEVCFNVALDHLPQSAMAMGAGAGATQALLPQQAQAQAQPILSNALMAALKRAHAHQRRGCPEHQQSPLLAVKVEIDQLIISILDDPSVSRVMKEAGFSSTNVKFNLEDGSSSVTPGPVEPPHGAADQVGSFYDAGCVTSEENETKSAVKFSPGAVVNPAMSAWPQAEVASPEVAFRGPRSCSRDEDVQNILDIFLRPRNAILIGDATVNANATVEDMALRIKNGSVPTQLQGLQFLDPKLSSSSFGYCSSLEMEQKLAELSKIVEECMPAGAILHIGDLQWLAEPMQLKKGPSNFCPAQRTAAELRQLLIRHANHRLWFVGVATSSTFARLQTLYPSFTSEWGLELVHISTSFQPSQPAFLHRFAGNVQSGSDQPRPSMVDDSNDRFQCCATCLAKFEEERRQVHENENLSLHLAPAKWFDEVTSGGVKKNRSSALLQLQQRWQKTCRLLHGEPSPSPSPLSRLSSKPSGLGLDMSPRWSRPSAVVDKPAPQRVVSPEAASEPAGSPQDDSSSASALEENEDPNGTTIHHQDAPIQTNLALGMATKQRANPSPLAAKPSPLSAKNGGKSMWMLQSSPLQQRLASKTNPWQSSSPLARRGVQQLRKSPSPPPAPLKEFAVVDDTLKGLYKALMQRVPWQGAAVAGISATVMKCRSGMGNIRGASAKTDTWLLLLGPDPVAKQAIAKALAETVFGGERSLLHLGFSESSPAKLLSADNGVRYTGRTPIDRLVEAIRVKKSAVVLLEDIDQANSTTRASIIRAMEISKLADSNGREVHMGNTIVVMTTRIGTETICESKPQLGSLSFSEAKLASLKPAGRATIHASLKTSPHPKRLFTTKNISVTQNSTSPRDTDTFRRDLPSWVPKRKVSNGELSLRPCKRTKSNFLNLDLNLATSEGGDEECGDSEDAKLQKVLAEARYALTDKFCALPDYAVGFAAYDFNGLATEVLNKLGNSTSFNVEIDLELLEHLIACVWKMRGGRPAFQVWLEEVFTKSIAGAGDGASAVMELSLSIDDVTEQECSVVALPHAVVLSTE